MQVKNKKILYILKKWYIILMLYGDVFGFDNNLEVQIASSGWLLWPL